MSKQTDLHSAGIDHTNAIKTIIDDLKSLGPCPMDGWNALRNLEERVRSLLDRFPHDSREQTSSDRQGVGLLLTACCAPSFSIVRQRVARFASRQSARVRAKPRARRNGTPFEVVSTANEYALCQAGVPFWR